MIKKIIVPEDINLIQSYEVEKSAKDPFRTVITSDLNSGEKYEISFYGDSFVLILNDQNWNSQLHLGGIGLLKLKGITIEETPETQEEYPLSYLFQLYLTISEQPRSDPQIIEWICKYLTGPKQLYLQHLYEKYNVKVSVKHKNSIKLTASSQKTIELLDREIIDSIKLNNIWAKESPAHRKLYRKHTKLSNVPEQSYRKNLILQRQSTFSKTMPWEYNSSDITILSSKISSEKDHTIYKAKWKGVIVAIKVMEFNEDTQKNYIDFLEEVALMSCLIHPNIIRFFGACITPPNLFIINEFATKGVLFKLLEQDRQNCILDFPKKLTIAVHAARGLYYLHSHNPPIIHKDIKSLNLFVFDGYTVKLGCNVINDQYYSTKLGKINWSPPEILKDNGPHTVFSDIYSFGVVMWEIMTSDIPYGGIDNIRILRMIVTGELLKIPKNIPIVLQQLLLNCWDQHPEKRLTAEIVLNSLEQLELE